MVLIFLVFSFFYTPSSNLGERKRIITIENLNAVRYAIRDGLEQPDAVVQLKALNEARGEQDRNYRLTSVLIAHKGLLGGKDITDGWGQLFKVKIEPPQLSEEHGVDQIVVWSIGLNGVNRNGSVDPKLLIRVPLQTRDPQSEPDQVAAPRDS